MYRFKWLIAFCIASSSIKPYLLMIELPPAVKKKFVDVQNHINQQLNAQGLQKLPLENNLHMTVCPLPGLQAGQVAQVDALVWPIITSFQAIDLTAALGSATLKIGNLGAVTFQLNTSDAEAQKLTTLRQHIVQVLQAANINTGVFLDSHITISAKDPSAPQPRYLPVNDPRQSAIQTMTLPALTGANFPVDQIVFKDFAGGKLLYSYQLQKKLPTPKVNHLNNIAAALKSLHHELVNLSTQL